MSRWGKNVYWRFFELALQLMHLKSSTCYLDSLHGFNGQWIHNQKVEKKTSCYAYVNMGSFATDLKFISLPKAVSQIFPHVQKSLVLYRL
jgi:hypothetical protein